MSQAIRDFSYLFTYSKRIEKFSTLSRIFLSLIIIILIFASRIFSANLISEFSRISIILIYEILAISYFKGLKSTISALRLVLLFLTIGTTVFLVSHALGWVAPSPPVIITGSLSLVAFFISFSLLFQLLTIKEWRRIISILGLKKHANIFTLVLSQIPITIYYVSEAFTTVRLKYGNRKLYKVVLPLMLITLYSARNLIESSLIYGVTTETKLVIFKNKDVLIYTSIGVLLILFYLFHISLPH